MNPNQSNKQKFFRGRGFFYRNRGRGRGFIHKNRNSNQNGTDDIKLKPESPKQSKIDRFTVDNCVYRGWKFYFPEQEYKDDSPIAHKVRAVETFLKNNSQLYDVAKVEESRYFTINVNLLYSDENLKSSWENLESDLRDNPNDTISCIGLAMHQVVLTKLQEEMANDELSKDFEGNEIEVPMIRARILNFGPIVLLKNLKSNYFGKLITVKGTIIRVGNMKLTCTWMAFQCDTCEAVQCLKQCDGIYTMPTGCTGRGCRSKSFTPLLSSPYTQTLNWQCVRLQEIVSDEHREGGRVPRNIDCELTCDLVDSCSPGDVAIVTGIIKIRNSEDGIKQKSSNIFVQYMDVVSISNCKRSEGENSEVEFNMNNYYAIKEIHSEENLFRLIVQSLCPSIFGHEIVKAGLVLAMFGGCQRYEECRADPHVLVVGDPGLGKSRMLQACASVAPRGVYVCGNTSTVSGLTVTLAREGGDYVLEAGALVLSDQGVCCIDEFDKMTSQHQALLEAMEQQTVSIAKSGVVCALPCRASILAAANPVGGHYNKAKTVSENLKLGPSLLSRFDLVFILMDQPSVQADSMLSDHVMAMHSGLKGNSTCSSLSNSFVESSTPLQRDSLLERLKVQPGEELDLIPHQLLRKYIAYARKYVKPELTEEASDILMRFYMELRRSHQDSDSTPVTPRQLESLIRFTEARAKLELRVEATAEDAQDVIEILKHSLLDMFTDDYGYLDFNRSQNGSGTSTKNQAKKFINALQRLSELQSRSVFSTQELKEIARSASVNVPDFFSFLSTLNVQGYLLKKGSQLYQLLSVE